LKAADPVLGGRAGKPVPDVREEINGIGIRVSETEASTNVVAEAVFRVDQFRTRTNTNASPQYSVSERATLCHSGHWPQLY